MTEIADAPTPPESPSAPARAGRRRVVWRALIAALLLTLLFVLYGGRLGSPSQPREALGQLQRLAYPGSLGEARVRRLGPAFERIQIGGFGEPAQRGPRAALEAVWKMTRAGGMLFEVRGLASPAEGAYLLEQKPYACSSRGDTDLIEQVGGVQIRRARRWLLFRWLPTPVSLCGSAVRGSVLTHASGFATEGTWVRERARLLAMLREWEVDREVVPHDAEGCRLHTEHEPPLYVQFKSEALAAQGRVTQDSILWIDLPYEGQGRVGRFTPRTLEEVSSACAREQARFAKYADEGASASRSAEAQNAHHAFMARCGPLFPMLRFFGADTLDPDRLPRPRSGWSWQLDSEKYAPALCVPVEGVL